MRDSMELADDGVENAGENAGKKRRRSKHLYRKVAKKAATKEAKRKSAVGHLDLCTPVRLLACVVCLRRPLSAPLPQMRCLVVHTPGDSSESWGRVAWI